MNPFEIPEQLNRYAEEHSSEEDPLLKDLFRYTHLKAVHPQMISGKVQGQFLSMISRMIRPTHILEIGTYTGYSSYCLCQGLREGGKLTSIEVNEELSEMILQFFSKAGISDKCELLCGDALDIIPRLEEQYDLVFIDANKEHYVHYYDLVVDRITAGGYILADNVLWGGKVIDSTSVDESTRTLQKFNEMITADPRVENVLLTIRDGLMLIRKT